MSDSQKSYNQVNVVKDLDRYYYNNHLRAIYEQYIKELAINNKALLKKYHIEFNQKKTSKLYFSTIISNFIVIDELRELFLQSLPQAVYDVFEYISWWGETDHQAIKKVTQKTIVKKKTPGYLSNDYVKQIQADFCFFCFELTQTDYFSDTIDKFDMNLPYSFRFFFKQSFDFPEQGLLHYYDSAKEAGASAKSHIFNNEEGIFNELLLTQIFAEQKLLSTTKQGKPTKASLRKLHKNIESTEFFIEPDNKELQFMHNHFLALMTLVLKTFHSETISDPMALLEYHTNRLKDGISFSLLDHAMIHLKGRHHTKYYHGSGEDDLHKTLFQQLKKLTTSQWLKFDNWERNLYFNNIDIDIADHYALAEYAYFNCKSQSSSHYDPRMYLNTPGKVEQGLTIPLLKSCLFLYASLGMLELAYNEPVNKKFPIDGQSYLSIYDGLYCFRLTKLGAYLVGKNKSYQLKNQDIDKAQIILDSERLLITFHGQDKLKSTVLNEMTHKVGDNRYKMDYQSFLSGCKNITEIENKIKQFKIQIAAKPPKNWLDFFAKILAQANPLTRLSTIETFKLTQNKELYQLIANDPQLKKYVLKAENYHVLITKKNLPQVKKLLTSHGFFIS